MNEKLAERLRKEGYLFSTKGEMWGMPTRPAEVLGLFQIETRIINRPDGVNLISRTAELTARGMKYFAHYLKDEAALGNKE